MSEPGRWMRCGLGVALLFVVGCQAPPVPVQQARQPGSERRDEGWQPRSERRDEGRRAREHSTEAAGFAYYLLNLSWSPEYCHSHPDAEQCAEHQAFVLHGLWPENRDGTYPENCSGAAGSVDAGRYAGLYPSPGLVEHEWRAHGTCSGMGPDGYFEAVRRAKAAVRIPAALQGLRQGVMMPPERIVGLFAAANPGLPAGSVVVSCGNNYLTAVEVCLDKGLRPMQCGEVRSCRANVVRVPAP